MSPVDPAIRPSPNDEEAAAIMAAVEVLWPRPGGGRATTPETPAWRFSGRWWVKPVAARRQRPR